MNSRKSSDYYRYATSDPFRSVNNRLIRGAYEETLKREHVDRSLRQLRAGQLASELAIHGSLSSHDANRWLSLASQHLTSPDIGSHHGMMRDVFMAYLPQFGNVPQAKRLQHERLLQAFAKGFNQLLHNVDDDNLFGQVNEVAAHIAIASLARHGVTGRVAFIREESNLRRSEQGLRNRDMTVFSDGSSVPAGTYAIQIKTSHPVRETDTYDPRIITLYGEDLHAQSDNSVRSLVRSVHAMTKDCVQPDNDIIFNPTNQVIETVLPTLEQAGPYTT